MIRLQAVVAGDAHHGAARRVRRHPERVALALDDEDRHPDRVELVEPALVGPARRMNGEGEADHTDRTRGRSCSASDARARRSPTRDDPETRERSPAELCDDRRPRSVELCGRRRRPAARDSVRLLDEHDGDAGRGGSTRRCEEIRCVDAPTSAVAEDERSSRTVDQLGVGTRRAVRCCDFENVGHGSAQSRPSRAIVETR